MQGKRRRIAPLSDVRMDAAREEVLQNLLRRLARAVASDVRCALQVPIGSFDLGPHAGCGDLDRELNDYGR